MSTDLKAAVEGWLAKQGFPLEMKVAAEFRKAGFFVIQSDFYEDPVTKTQREIDVAAHLQTYVAEQFVRVRFIIECKVSRDKPWVIFTSDSAGLAEPASVAQRAGSMFGRQFLFHVCHSAHIQNLPFFRQPARPAYALVQALREFTAKDSAYDALTGVSAATSAAAAAADAAIQSGQGKFIEMIFPVVLVDGRLFECYLDQTGAVTVGEVSEGTLVWRNPVAGSFHSIIRIATLSALPDVISDALATALALFKEDEAAVRAVRE